jgi:hypothetical protein
MRGQVASVAISVEDLESLEETLDVMGSAPLLDDIREALAELSTAVGLLAFAVAEFRAGAGEGAAFPGT